jgi:hypothetical protein
MEHNKAVNKLGAFMDKQLDAKTASELSLHISQCFICQAELEVLKKTDETLLSARREVDYNPYFRTRLFQVIKDGKIPKLPSFGWLPIPVGLALVLLIFSGVMFSAPVIYGGGLQDVKSMALKAFVPDSPAKIFGPAGYLDLCSQCSTIMCRNCKNMNPNSKCMMKGCGNEQK